MGGGVAPAQDWNGLVDDFLSGVLLGFDEINHLRPFLAELKATEREPTFNVDDPETEEVESIPIYFGKDNEILWLSLAGELDRGEVELLDSLFAVIQGIVETLLTVDWNVNSNELVNSGIDLVLGMANQTYHGLEEEILIVPAVTSIVGSLLNNSPTFLTLDYSSDLPLGGGPELLADAASKLGESCEGFLTAFDRIRNESDDQGDDPVAIVVKEGKETFRINYLDPDGNPQVIDVAFGPEFSTAIQNIQDSVRAEKGVRVSWANDLSWILAYGAVFLLQTGGVSALLDLTVAKVDPLLAEDINGYVESLAFSPDLLTPSLIRGIVISILPDVIQLDLGYFYHHPTDPYFRGLLPYWIWFRDDDDNWDPEGNGTLVLEYECDLPETGFLCPEPLTMTTVDIPHFVPEQQVPAYTTLELGEGENREGYQLLPINNPDGMLSPIPYIPWLDPSFNQLLYLNLRPLGCDQCPDDFAKPDLWELNYFTVTLFGPLMDLISSFE
jgi:hypothetical protein